MSKILVLNSSILGEASSSRKLVDETVARLVSEGHEVTANHDLGANPLPHLSADTLAAFTGNAQTEAQKQALALSDKLIGELQEADTLVIGAPMYNFAIPTNLKSWFDHVLRAGITFRYTESGPEGLLEGKRAIILLTRGGLYSEGPAAVMDSQEPHLRNMLSFMGIKDVTVIRAEKLNFGEESKSEAMAAAKTEVEKVAA